MFTSSLSPYSRKNPFGAPLRVNRLLSGPASEKETRHFELDLSGSDLRYECGDSLGVFPKNCPDLVADLLAALHLTGDEIVVNKDGVGRPLRDALLEDFVITQPSREFINALVERSGDGAPTLRQLLNPERKQDLDDYLYGIEYLDLLLSHPSARFTAEDFAKTLRKLQPRLYSIASSQRAFPSAVHLTVAVVRYTSNGRERKGVASSFLADRVPQHSPVPIFVHSAKGFRPPEDPSTPMIMVGPGTGVAPFRAFLQDRAATGAKGKNWLFFGEQRRSCDFLYQEEMESWHRDGLLHRFDTAFSRDQAHKIYVQDRMLDPENASEIWRWLDADGAHFFVCGDAKRMAKDVDAALHTIVRERGGKSEAEAAEYIEALKKSKRYKRDVY